MDEMGECGTTQDWLTRPMDNGTEQDQFLYQDNICCPITSEPKPLGRRGSLMSFVFITCNSEAHFDRM
ncbi:UNVERIFIED_CONTAM: hypothetical protein FKN15_044201 [Acipenser sinensis]